MSYEPENPSSDIGQDAQAWLAREFDGIAGRIALYVDSGTGGLVLTAPVANSDVITTSPKKVAIFDAINYPLVATEANLANATIRLLSKGVWTFGAKLVYSIVSTAANRTMRLLVFDETNGTNLGVLDHVWINANQTLLTMSANISFTFKTDEVGVELALYIDAPTGDVTMSNVDLAEWAAYRVSNLESVQD